MSEYAKPIDVGTSTDLRRIVEQVQVTRQPIPITRDDEVVAVLRPVGRSNERRARLPSEAALAASRSTFGALKGILDDRMMRDIYTARGSNRRPVKL